MQESVGNRKCKKHITHFVEMIINQGVHSFESSDHCAYLFAKKSCQSYYFQNNPRISQLASKFIIQLFQFNLLRPERMQCQKEQQRALDRIKKIIHPSTQQEKIKFFKTVFQCFTARLELPFKLKLITVNRLFRTSTNEFIFSRSIESQKSEIKTFSAKNSTDFSKKRSLINFILQGFHGLSNPRNNK